MTQPKIQNYSEKNKTPWSESILNKNDVSFLVSTNEASLLKKLIVLASVYNTHMCIDIQSNKYYSSIKRSTEANEKYNYIKHEKTVKLNNKKLRRLQNKNDLMGTLSEPYKNPGMLIDVLTSPVAVNRLNIFFKAEEFDEFYSKDNLLHILIKNANQLKSLLADLDEKNPLIIYINKDQPTILKFITILLPKKEENVKSKKNQTSDSDDSESEEQNKASGAEEESEESEEGSEEESGLKTKKIVKKVTKKPVKKVVKVTKKPTNKDNNKDIKNVKSKKNLKVSKKILDDETEEGNDETDEENEDDDEDVEDDGEDDEEKEKDSDSDFDSEDIEENEEDEIPDVNLVEVSLSDSCHECIPEDEEDYFIFRWPFVKLNSICDGFTKARMDNITIYINKRYLVFKSSTSSTSKQYTRNVGKKSKTIISSSYDSKVLNQFLKSVKGLETERLIIGISNDGPIILTFLITHGRISFRINKKDPTIAK